LRFVVDKVATVECFYRVNPPAHANIIHECFTLIFNFTWSLAEGHPGAPGEPSGETMFFRQLEALDREIISFFRAPKI